MDLATKLIQAVATLLWPLIVIAVLFIFRPAILILIDSARSRKFSLKIGGQELTMEEANQQQQKLIADLQSSVVNLQKHLGEQALHNPTVMELTASARRSFENVLWVDDNPKNNSYFVQRFTDMGAKVDLATSTAEGASRFASKRYDLVLSDMGRHEDGRYKSTAGLDLLQIVRAANSSVPFVLFCSSEALRKYGKKALDLGASAVTSSATELSGILKVV